MKHHPCDFNALGNVKEVAAYDKKKSARGGKLGNLTADLCWSDRFLHKRTSNQNLRNTSKFSSKFWLLKTRISQKQLIINGDSSNPKLYQTPEETINTINDFDIV